MPNRAELQLHVNRYRQRAVRTASQKTVADDETWGEERERERASCSCEQRPQELYNFHKRTHRTLLNLKSIIILNLILYHTIRHLQHMNEPKKKTTKTKKTTHTVKRTEEKQQRTQTRLLSVARLQLNVSTLKESRRHDSIARTCCCNATQRSRCLISHLNFFFAYAQCAWKLLVLLLLLLLLQYFRRFFFMFCSFSTDFSFFARFLYSTLQHVMPTVRSSSFRPNNRFTYYCCFLFAILVFFASCLIPSVDRCDGSDREMERKSVRE